MKVFRAHEPDATLSNLLSLVESGEEVVVERDGVEIARVTPSIPVAVREPGSWRRFPGCENFQYDPGVFAPMTDEELKEEGWN